MAKIKAPWWEWDSYNYAMRKLFFLALKDVPTEYVRWINASEEEETGWDRLDAE
jgi:hypothetical protein